MPRLQVGIGVALCYAIAVAISILLAQVSLQTSTIWLASGVGLAAVLIWGYWLLPVLAIVHLLTSQWLGSDLGWLARSGWALIAVAEMGLASLWLQRGRPGLAPRLNLRGTARFTFIALLVVPLAGSLLAASWLLLLGLIDGDTFYLIARNWFVAVVLGIASIVPLVSNLLVHGVPRFHGRGVEARIVLMGLLIPTGLILGYQLTQHNPVEAMLYASLPLLLWASVFLRETGAAIAVTLLVLGVVGINGVSPDHALPIWIIGAHIIAFGLMALIIGSAQSSLEEAITDRARQAELEYLAYHDALTGLPNRAQLLRALDGLTDMQPKGGPPFAVLMMDLDGFKPVNDRLGHAAGDAVLRIVAERLQRHCKAADHVARFGGDEFVIVLPHCPDYEQARKAGERLREVIRQPIQLPASKATDVAHVDASIGIVHSGQVPPDPDALLAAADQALYQAKATGRARITAYATH
ncbi:MULTISPECIES: diguanylate cyclase [unclassified Thioalkalivibrio]|uniref:diguanylate cyclase n=1 Tax=unclassified Thioalkalivibrio TaxID=2621013 RepID=UPI000361BFFD|nr:MULTISPECIES: diguanylate cyclase [unclassified Thioalkalivibrio]